MKQFAIGGLTAVALLLEILSTSEGAEVRIALLNGFEEVPSISTTGESQFRAFIRPDETAIDYQLGYSGLEGGSVLAAHIHLGQPGVSGGIIAFLCGGGNKPACPSPGGSVLGTIVASDIVGPVGQGIAPGELAEVLRAIRAGKTYANVHTTTYPAGEIRGQIK